MRDVQERTRPAVAAGRRFELAGLRTARPLYGTRRAASSLPPYGREVEAALDAGKHPNVRVYACRPDPWEPAKQHRYTFGPGTTLVLPIDADPEALHWPRVRDLIADITDLRGDRVHALARALVRDGCRLAYLLDANDSNRNLRVIVKGWRP